MKKMYLKTRGLIQSHFKLVVLISFFVWLVGAVVIVWYKQNILTGMIFVCPFVVLLVLTLYKIGPITFTQDTIWSILSKRYPEDEAEEIYKATHLKIATIAFMLTMISYAVWIIVELIIGIFFLIDMIL